MLTHQTETDPESFSGISTNPKWHWPQNPEASWHTTTPPQQSKSFPKTTLANALCWGLGGWFFPTLRCLKCILPVHRWTLGIHNMSIAHTAQYPEHIAWHSRDFSPSQTPTQSICQSSFFQTFGPLRLHSFGFSELPLRSPMSLRNLARNHLGF